MLNVQSIVVDPEIIIPDRTLEKFESGTRSGSRPYLALLMLEAALFPKSCNLIFIIFYL